MPSRESKKLLGVYALLLIIILFTFSEGFGAFLLIGTGLFTLVISKSITNDIKRLTNSLTSRIISVILINLILYSVIILFYGLGNIGIGADGGVFILTSVLYPILIILSLIIGIISVARNRDQSIGGKPNKILSIIFIIVLILLFYGSIVSGVAKLASSPGLCSMYIEGKEDSFIFRDGYRDDCIFRVALDSLNVEYCEKIKDVHRDLSNSLKNNCILNIGSRSGDASVCYLITNDQEKQARCISRAAENSGDLSLCETPGVDRDMCYSDIARGEDRAGNPEVCNYVENNEARYYCYSIIAIDKRDTSICEKYFPSNEILAEEGVSTEHYSKEQCVTDAQKGHFS